jgi:D-glycero-alpha-D-manno-heptose 1-phosphate guanylyltransferase
MLPIKTAIVLAGGLGTRLRSVVNDRPKPMAEIRGKPFLDYLMTYWSERGIERFLLSTGYLGHLIEGHFGSAFGATRILYAREEVPLGTGGAIKRCLPLCRGIDKHVLVLNGDTWFTGDLKKLSDDHFVAGKAGCICLKQVNLNDRYGTVEVNESGLIQAFTGPTHDRGLINAGVYLFDVEAMGAILEQLPVAFSLESELLAPMAGRAELSSSVQTGDFIDIGLPRDYEKAQTAIFLKANEPESEGG